MTTSKIIPTHAQETAIQAAIEFLQRRPPGPEELTADYGTPLFRIGGYAGTGKTTIAYQIKERSGLQANVCAFTGKAASVLRRKGLTGAKTIHRTIYEWDELLQEFQRMFDLSGDYILLDEGSMVSKDLWADLCSFGKPIIAIGDPGQLEPVGDDPRLMHDPDVVLEEIHRQAKGSQIIGFANAIRHNEADYRSRVDGEVELLPRKEFYANLAWADHVLCGFNKTRVTANERIRQLRGFKGLLEEGERIICLRNDKELGLFNGVMLTVERIYDESERWIRVDARDDDGVPYRKLKVNKGQFGQEKLPPFDVLRRIREQAICDYGYATTVHKFQGSEAEKVLVMDQQCQAWDPARWRYTAVTRASHQLRYCIDPPKTRQQTLAELGARFR